MPGLGTWLHRVEGIVVRKYVEQVHRLDRFHARVDRQSLDEQAANATVLTRLFYGHDQLMRVQLDSGRTLSARLGTYGGIRPGDVILRINGAPVSSVDQVSKALDAVAAGGEFLLRQGYERVWGMGRHILGSQIFDYWHDPDKLMVEHFTDGDLFDNTVEVGWAPMTASGLYQWGPPVNRKFLTTTKSISPGWSGC